MDAGKFEFVGDPSGRVYGNMDMLDNETVRGMTEEQATYVFYIVGKDTAYQLARINREASLIIRFTASAAGARPRIIEELEILGRII